MLETHHREQSIRTCQSIHMLRNNGLKKKDKDFVLTRSFDVAITSAFGTNMAVFVFLMTATESTGITI